MRLKVVYDENGRILAAAAVPEGNDDMLAVTPIAGARQIAAEVDVPDNIAGDGLLAICTRMRVDPHRKQLVANDEGQKNKKS